MIDLSFKSVEALAAITAVEAGYAVKRDRTIVYGPYSGWFDRDLYSVEVLADSLDEAERAARSTSMEWCLVQGKTPEVVESEAYQLRERFILTKPNRYSFSMEFRCASKVIKNE